MTRTLKPFPSPKTPMMPWRAQSKTPMEMRKIMTSILKRMQIVTIVRTMKRARKAARKAARKYWTNLLRGLAKKSDMAPQADRLVTATRFGD